MRLIGASNRACAGFATLGAVVAMLVAAPMVSAKSSTSPLAVLAKSSAGKQAQRILTAALPAAGVSRAAQDLLVQDGSKLTSFETGLLKIATIIGAPSNQAVMSAVSRGRRLSSSQIRTLSRLLVSVGDNPAVRLLVQKGRALRRDRGTLASYLAADAAAPGALPAELPSTGSAALDSIDAQLARAERSPPVASVEARLRKILAGRGVAQYLSTLPPLVVASLIPVGTLETYALPVQGDALDGRFTRPPVANPYLTATQNAALRIGLDMTVDWTKDLTQDAALALAGRVGLTGAAEGIAIFLVGEPLAYVIAGGYIIGKAVSDLIETGESITQYLYDVYQADHPIGLALLPGVNVSMIAGSGTLFVVEDSTPGCPLCGTEPKATVSMVSSGGVCPAHVCTTTVAGPNGVIARMGDATTSIPVTVLPAALKNMNLSPSSATAPQGIGTTFVATGSDMYNNPVDISDKTNFTIDPGEPNGWCEGAICGADTPGVYTVKATSGTISRTATLTVLGAARNLEITPAPGQWLVGTHHDFLVQEVDANGNPILTLGGNGPQVVVTLDPDVPDGSCDTLGCTANSPGPHHVTATYTDPDTGQMLTGTLPITVFGPLDHLTLSPSSASVAAGTAQTYTVEGWDAADDDLGPDPGATLSISPDGTCTDDTCTPADPGDHTVTATDGTATGEADLIATGPSSPPVVYVANYADDTVSAIDSTTNTVIATIPLESGASPDGVSVTPDGARAYVSDAGTGDVSVIDTSTDAVVATISVGGLPTGSAVTPDGTSVWVANAAGDVTVIDTSTNAVEATVPIDTYGADPRAVTISPDGSLAYVSDGYGDDVVVLSTASDTTVADIPLDGFTTDVVLSPDGQTAYAAYHDVLNLNLDGVATIDTSAEQLDSTFGFGRGVTWLAISPDAQTVYAAQTYGQVTALTASPMSVITNIPSSTSGSAIAITPDGNYLYTTGPGNDVTEISTATDAVAATIPVGTSPSALAMTP